LSHDVKILVGEYFLTGKKVIEQKETKKVGQDISYYKVTKIDGNNISYVMIFDKLEED